MIFNSFGFSFIVSLVEKKFKSVVSESHSMSQWLATKVFYAAGPSAPPLCQVNLCDHPGPGHGGDEQTVQCQITSRRSIHTLPYTGISHI